MKMFSVDEYVVVKYLLCLSLIAGPIWGLKAKMEAIEDDIVHYERCLPNVIYSVRSRFTI